MIIGWRGNARVVSLAGLTTAALCAVTPAAAAAAGSSTENQGCEPGSGGIAVVLDPGPLGGDVTTRCVPGGAGLSAAEVTRDAGVEVTWVGRYRGTFVCRLQGLPADLPCANTPPDDRYWGLFWAEPGDRSWTYSTSGAGSLVLPAGGTVGWRFQDGGEQEVPSVEAASQVTATASDASTADTGTRDASPVPLSAAALAAVALGAATVAAKRRRGR